MSESPVVSSSASAFGVALSGDAVVTGAIHLKNGISALSKPSDETEVDRVLKNARFYHFLDTTSPNAHPTDLLRQVVIRTVSGGARLPRETSPAPMPLPEDFGRSAAHCTTKEGI